MREILFRGKRVDNGEWIEGYYLFNGEFHRIFETGRDTLTSTGFYTGWAVHPESVGQFTGLLDKNGKKIFEGDVMDYAISKNQVVFLNGSFGIINKHEDGSSFGSYQIENGVVIGNIHNPI